MNPSYWAYALPAATFLLSALGIYGGWVIGRYKGELAHSTAITAIQKAEEAREAGRIAAALIAGDLAAYKAEVESKFAHVATIEMLTRSEDRVADALSRLTNRLDRVLEQHRDERP